MNHALAAALQILSHTWTLFLEAAPWLLFGVFIAGLIKAFVPEHRVAGWLGGRGVWPVSKAALIGAPLPLCSCSVIPVAIGLHRAGASRASTTAFLVSAPETGVDSVAASYVLLGPFLAVVRPLAAMVSALVTGLVSNLAPVKPTLDERSAMASSGCCSPRETVSACCSKVPAASSAVPSKTAGGGCCSAPANGPVDSCCGSARAEPAVNAAAGCGTPAQPASSDTCCAAPKISERTHATAWQRLKTGQHYAITQIFAEFAPWLAIGLLVAGATLTFVPPSALAAYGSGLPAMLLLLLVSVPLYVCATESTPIATALLAAGVSAGAVLVFLMAGPATNVATIGALRKEFGAPFVGVYLAGVGGCAIVAGLLTDALVGWLAIDVVPQFDGLSSVVPLFVSLPCAVVLLLLAVPTIRRRLTHPLEA